MFSWKIQLNLLWHNLHRGDGENVLKPKCIYNKLYPTLLKTCSVPVAEKTSVLKALPNNYSYKLYFIWFIIIMSYYYFFLLFFFLKEVANTFTCSELNFV